MIRFNKYQDIIGDKFDTFEIENGKSLKDSFPEIDWINTLCFCGGHPVDESFIPKEGDIVTARTYPSGSAVKTVKKGFNYVKDKVSDAVDFVKGKLSDFKDWAVDKIRDWLGIEEPEPYNQDTTAEESLPSLKGAKNQSLFGKVIPFTIGMTRFTPFIVGKPYTTISGTDGETQIYHSLFICGYNDIAVGSFKIGNTDIAKNGFTESYSADNTGRYTLSIDNEQNILNGNVTIDTLSGMYRKANPAIEIRNGNSEVSLYSQKVVQEDINKQILNANGSKLKFDRFSTKYPEKVQVEIAFNSLMRYDDNGNMQSTSVKVAIGYSLDNGKTFIAFPQVIGSNSYAVENLDSDDISAGLTGSLGVSTITRAKNKNMRFIAELALTYTQAVYLEEHGQGVLCIRVEKRTADSTDTKISNQVYLSAIRTWCYDHAATREAETIISQAPVIAKIRDKTTRVGFQITATDNITGTLNEFNCMQVAKCRIWNSSTEKWSDTKMPTDNPAANLINLLESDMLGTHKYTDTELDMEKFGELYEYCEEKELTVGGALTKQQKLSDVVDLLLNSSRSYRILNGQKYSVFIDKPVDVPVCVLNNHNILKDGLNNTKSFADLPDGYKVQFVNRNIGFETDEVYVMFTDKSYDDPDAIIESKSMPMQTDPRMIFKNAWYMYATEKQRPEVWTRNVASEGNLIEIGSLVAVQDDTISVGIGNGGYIQTVTDENGYITKFTIDGGIDFPDSETEYGVKIVRINSLGESVASVYKLLVTQVGYQIIFTLAVPILDTDENAPCVGDLCSFGVYERETISALCMGKTANEDGTFTLTLVPYDESIYSADSIPLPDFDSKITVQHYTENGKIEPETITKAELAKFQADINSGSSSAGGTPDKPSISTCFAGEKSISISAVLTGVGLRNAIASVDWQMFKWNSSILEQNEDLWEWIDLPSSGEMSTTYFFDRNIDDYPEAEILNGTNSVWYFRCRVVNSYGNVSEWSKKKSVNTDNYGTWVLNTPAVNASVTSRYVTLKLSQPPRADGKEVYGNTKYRVEVMRPDIDNDYYKPATGLNPYAAEDNYKDGSGYVISDGTYVQVMPLKGQDTELIENTLYMFRITAENEAGISESTVINTVTECDSIRDIVKAKETAKEAYISQLSAISANMGCISGGSFNGSQTNYWELSSFVDDNNVNHHEGAFRVGGDNEYMWVIPIDEYGNDITSSTPASVRPASYRIEFQVGSFHVNSTATEMNGDFIIQENQDSVDRIKVTPRGVYLEHRANAESPWVLIAGQNTNGVQSQQLYSEASLIVSNQGIDQRRQEKTDIGTPYISEDSQVYHFDTDVADQNKVDDLSIVPSDSYSLVDEQYGKDYTPAILAVSPFSTVAKSIMGLVSITKEFTAGTFTVDFWCKFLTNEDFTLFDLSTPAESVVIKTKKGECFLYEKAETEECPMFAEQDMPAYAMWELVPVVKCPMYHTADGEECQMMKKDDTVSRMYRATDTQFFQSVDYAQKIDGEYTKVVPTTLTYDSFAEGGLYVETCNYNTPDGECTTLEYEGSSFERRVISWSDEDKDEGLLPHKFNSGDWIHCAVVFSEGRVKVFLGVTDGTVASVSFIRNSETALLTSLVLNSQKKSMLFDELLVDTTTAESLEVFTCNTVQRRPWGALPYSDERNYFILEAENTDLIKTNIGKSSELRADLSDFMFPVGALFRSTVDETPHFTGSWVLLDTETLGGKTIYNYERIS